MDRVDVEPELLRWARERAGLSIDALAGRFPQVCTPGSGVRSARRLRLFFIDCYLAHS